jgi:outer membrane protein TolC
MLLQFRPKVVSGVVVLALLTMSAMQSALATEDVNREVASKKWVLTEESLVALLPESNPDFSRLGANVERARFDENEERERFGWRLFAEGSYQDSQEKSLAFFIPTFGPNYLLALGVKKVLPYGVDAEVSLFGDQQSTQDGSIDAATRTGLHLKASIDLWKNLFGRLDRADLDSQKLMRQQRTLRAKIDKRTIELNLRKLYWSIVANNEQRLVSTELLKTAEYQLSEGKKRSRKYIADKGEIARYQAQVANRRATLLSLQYQRDLFIQQLKEALPTVALANIELGGYDPKTITADVLVCVGRINQAKEVPWDYTSWDETLKLLAEHYQQQKLQSERYSGVDLKLNGQVRLSGVDRGYSDSFADFGENGQPGYEVGLRLEMPLDASERRSKKARQAADQMEFEADRQQILAKVHAHHSQIMVLISVLQQSILRLDENNESLRVSIAEMKSKYRQARVSVNELIQDQDSLLQGLLTRIDANLQVIHTLLDYFKVFTDEPCKLNRVAMSSQETK